MDDLDKQLAELQLITKGELKQNPNAEIQKVGKKVGPAVPPKPKKPQVYSNLPPIGVPKPYEKPPELSHSSYPKEMSATYANQDGLIYSNILHETKSNQRNMYPSDDLPPPPPPLMDEGLPPPPPPIAQTHPSSQNLYAPLNVSSNTTHQRQQNVSPYQMYVNCNQNANFYKAQPQVPTNYLKRQPSNPVYYNLPGNVGHEYSNIDMALNQCMDTYENTRIHQNKHPSSASNCSTATAAQFDNSVLNYPGSNIDMALNKVMQTYENTRIHQNKHPSSASNSSTVAATQFDNSVLNYPGSSISDYENQTEILENRAFRSGSSASRLEYDDHQPNFRSGSSASNYIHQPHLHHSGSYDRFNDQSESIYAPLGRSSDNDLPPPPPIMGGDTKLSSNLPPMIMCPAFPDSLTDEIPPPASPVSSSYSELRRATDLAPHHSIYNPYNPPSNISSTYESIYEPINPRPSSQNSTRSSGYSLYGQNSGKISNSGTLTNTQKPSKELEVDKLTNLLVQGLDSNEPDDVYGICAKCNEKIVGEENGCTAMDNFYHIDCFRCSQCDSNLQGKPFYAVEGKPYCEEDYLNTLEKCSVCVKPILDRILRATGKPYHPQCFTCVVCNKSLDSVPFTVDATNQIHCIEDFHKKFAPRCCVCKLPIMPEQGEEETVRVVALDRSFHIGCYKCEDCGLVLSSEAEGRGCYPLDGHVLCKSCNAIRVQALTKQMTTEL